MRFFGLKSCDTCRKALKEIAAAGIDVTVIDIRADGMKDADRASLIAHLGDAAINRASTTWRSLSDAERGADPADLLAVHPTLMKRPAIHAAGVWTVGWKADVAAQRLGVGS